MLKNPEIFEFRILYFYFDLKQPYSFLQSNERELLGSQLSRHGAEGHRLKIPFLCSFSQHLVPCQLVAHNQIVKNV